MYADYAYYTESFAGTKLSAEDFYIQARKAERFIDYVTQHRITEATNAVKNAVCAAAEALNDVNRQYADIPNEIKSENTDGYSVTYSDFDISKLREEENDAMLDAITRELSGTNLLYQGVG